MAIKKIQVNTRPRNVYQFCTSTLFGLIAEFVNVLHKFQRSSFIEEIIYIGTLIDCKNCPRVVPFCSSLI